MFHFFVKKKRSLKDVIEIFLGKIKKAFLKSQPIVKYEKELKFAYQNLNEEYLDFINQIIKREKVDVAICEFMNALPLIVDLPLGIRKVFVHHEIRFARLQEFLSSKKLNSPYYKTLFLALKSEEVGLLNMYDSIVTFSDVDSKKLKENGVATPIVTSFFSVDSSRMSLERHVPRKVLTFVGPEMHDPNYYGLLDFLKECWNELLNFDDELELHVVGNWSEKTISNLTNKYLRLRFLGYVDDLKSCLAGSLMIVPINMGSGIRTKILDAVYMGIPVLSTEIGIEGLPFQNDIDCIIVPTIGDMTKAIEENVNDLRKRDFLATNAYKKAKDYYSDERFLRTRMQAIENSI